LEFKEFWSRRAEVHTLQRLLQLERGLKLCTNRSVLRATCTPSNRLRY
jgi:hypothetical protein